MEIEVLKKSKVKRNILIGVLGVAIISAIILQFTIAKYRVSDTVSLIHSTINYKPYDFKIMAMYQEDDSGRYVEIEEMPSDGYTINQEKSYCTVGNVNKDEEAVFYTNDNGEHVFLGLKKSSKCYLYFDERLCPIGATACNLILESKNVNDSRSGAITGVFTSNTTGTVYSVADDDGTSYVYAGVVNDNWVRFAGFYWRIIRINGDGSIRMIYTGTSATAAGTSTQIQTSAYNNSYNDNAYLGYMYGSRGVNSYTSTHSNNNNSTIKGILDNWYRSNLIEYADSISTEAGFCNDRQTQSGIWSGYGDLGYGMNVTGYAPAGRLISGSWKTSQTPSLKCSQMGNDLFTVSESSKGNHKLTYPVGLITSDEVVLAGGLGGRNNTSYYLYTEQSYWTMSPSNFYTNGYAHVFYVTSGGQLTGYWVNGTNGVRPVINLLPNVTITGSGTSTDPYTVVL